MKIKSTLVSATIALLLFATSLVQAAPTGVTLVSSTALGGISNSGSITPFGTPDGRYIVFASYATDLVDGDVNSYRDIFRKDTQTGEVILVSVDSNGVPANDESGQPSISADGRYVAFTSRSKLWNNTITNNSQVYIRDVVAGTTTLVTKDVNGVIGDNESSEPEISQDGNYVVYTSQSDNLLAGTTSSYAQIFMYDRVNGTNTLVSKSAGGTLGNRRSGTARPSADGSVIAYASNSWNLAPGDSNGSTLDIYVYKKSTNTTTLESKSTTGVQATNNTGYVSISADGTKIAFYSDASNFGTTSVTTPDTNGMRDIFYRDLTTGTTTMVSLSSSGVQTNADSFPPRISPDGNYVVFVSSASNLIDGKFVFGTQIYLRDMNTGTTTLISADEFGVEGNDASNWPYIGNNGAVIAFESVADNLIPADTNGQSDIYCVGCYVEPDPTPTPNSGSENSDSKSPTVIPAAGFAQGKFIFLPRRAARNADQSTQLVIEKLGVTMSIVGVPQNTDGTWDVSWLGQNAGWLHGSAYPTWVGNSVLTGHVWNADNTPGPFAELNTLRYNDEIVLATSTGEYVYKVRSVEYVNPARVDRMLKHENEAWITLVTCHNYDEKSGSYLGRLLVKAVLIEMR